MARVDNLADLDTVTDGRMNEIRAIINDHLHSINVGITASAQILEFI